MVRTHIHTRGDSHNIIFYFIYYYYYGEIYIVFGIFKVLSTGSLGICFFYNEQISIYHIVFIRDYLCGPKKGRYCSLLKRKHLCTFSADSTGQLDVLWHDGNTLGVDGAQVGILEKTNQVGLASLLKSHDS